MATFDFDSDFGTKYDNFVRRTIFGYESLFQMILAMLTTRVGEQASVLVVGSGTGAELVTFGRGMPHWTLMGVDPSEKMIRQCHAKLDREGLAGRVQLHLGYTQDLPREAQYDAATLVLVMHFVPDDGAKLALLRSIAERLRPGGALVLVDHHGAPDSMEFQHLLAGWRNYQVLMGMPAAEAEAVLAQAVKTHHFISDTRTRELLQEAGFETVERFYGAFVTAGWFAQTHQ